MEEELRQLGRDFSRRALLPKWDELDEANPALLGDILSEAASAGLFSFVIPDTAGGSGLGTKEYTFLLEEISRVSGSVGALLAGHFVGIAPLLLAGSESANSFLSRVSEAESTGTPVLFAAAVQENAQSSFSASNLETTVIQNGRVCVVSGKKRRVLGAMAATFFSVLARDSAGSALHWLVVPRNADGINMEPEAARLGMRLCPVNDVSFHRVEVPNTNIIASFDSTEHLSAFYRFVDPALAAVSLGLAVEAYDAALAYACERYQGGRNICDHDAVRIILAEMALSIRAARALMNDPGADCLSSAFAAEMAERVCLDAIQVHGGYGYMRDYRIERILRDVKTFHATVAARARKMASIQGEIDKRK